jgi:hypothetical protein
LRKTLVLVLLGLGLSLGAILAFATPALCADDWWYADVNGHWASDYIYLLWSEGVTDGERAATGYRLYYRPDVSITRSHFAVFLFKVFQLPPASPETPSYPDVPKDYVYFRDKPWWEFIEGALAGGISFVPAGQKFNPGKYTTREDAVEFLINALDLGPYAETLTPDEIRQALSVFSDWEEVSEDRRASMACAVKLGIIDGYENWTLRPKRHMTRAEAAAVICRSCLIRVNAESDWFSPDGDGIDDTVGFDVTYLKNRGIARWQIIIATASGTPVYHFNWNEGAGEPPLYLVWDGTGKNGSTVPRGLYYYHAWVEDSVGRVFSSVAKPLFVEDHRLSAWFDPSTCTDGSPFEVNAQTLPAASSVVASIPGAGNVSLTSPDGTHWLASLIMAPPIPLGRHLATVTAYFPRAMRSIDVPFERARDLWLLASVEPNPAAWNQTLTLSCRASPAISRVSAVIFGTGLDLAQSQEGTWYAQTQVPCDIPAGTYHAVFTGFAQGDEIVAAVPVDIRSPMSQEVIYVLSK